MLVPYLAEPKNLYFFFNINLSYTGALSDFDTSLRQLYAGKIN